MKNNRQAMKLNLKKVLNMYVQVEKQKENISSTSSNSMKMKKHTCYRHRFENSQYKNFIQKEAQNNEFNQAWYQATNNISSQYLSRGKVTQYVIKGGTHKDILNTLKLDPLYKKAFSKNKKNEDSYLLSVNKLLKDVDSWKELIKKDDILEMLMNTEKTTTGVTAIRTQLIEDIGEKIDNKYGGHFGEKHYGKGKKYMEKRLIEEKNNPKIDFVTDVKITKEVSKYIEEIQNSAKNDLFRAIVKILKPLWSYQEIIPESDKKSVKEKLKDANLFYEFENYRILFEPLTVDGVGNGKQCAIGFKPVLTSYDQFDKYEYSKNSKAVREFEEELKSFWGKFSVIIAEDMNFLDLESTIWSSIPDIQTTF